MSLGTILFIVLIIALVGGFTGFGGVGYGYGYGHRSMGILGILGVMLLVFILAGLI